MDGRKDLLTGVADGTVRLYLNVDTSEDPQFDGGTLLQVGSPGSKTSIDVGTRATPVMVDWNNDAKRDLVVGAWDGLLRIYINEGTDSSPDYRIMEYAQDNGADLVVPTFRASPHVMDLDGDGKKDLLLGNTEGQILLYSNSGTDQAPVFSGYVYVETDGYPIDLAGSARSRPFVCDWNADGLLDLLVGGGDGLVHLYKGIDVTAVVRDELAESTPVVELLDAYPNPFNPSVTIPFVLSTSQRVTITVYSVSGRRVASLEDGVFSAGTHRTVWKGLDDEAQQVPSGVYFIRLNASGISSARRVVLLR